MPPTEIVLSCNSLDVIFQGDQVLYGVDAALHRNETVALLGANGSGKTTLVRALLGLTPAANGHIELFGSPLAQFNDWQRIGYVPQRGRSQVANATVREIVATGRLSHRKLFTRFGKDNKKAVESALERVGLTDRANDPLSVLSGGQQQRALIARALAAQAELLVLDEPLAALDLATQESLKQLFSRLKNDGLSMLVILHELGPMESLIDRSIMMQNGRKIYDGPLAAGPPMDSGHHHLEQDRNHPLVQEPAMSRCDINKEQ